MKRSALLGTGAPTFSNLLSRALTACSQIEVYQKLQREVTQQL